MPWKTTKARKVREALKNTGWQEVGSYPGPPTSYRRLRKNGNDYIFPWNDDDQLEPEILDKITRDTGLDPSDL